MSSLNKVQLIGNLGKDPEVRTLQNGNKVVSFSIATTESWRDKQTGDRKERTEWHNVVVFNENIADVAERYLRKGSKCYVEGELQTRKWQDKDGSDRYSTEVVLKAFRATLVLLGDPGGRSGGGDSGRGRDDGDDRGGGGRSGGGGSGRGSGGGGGGRPRNNDLDDDIPFAPEWR